MIIPNSIKGWGVWATFVFLLFWENEISLIGFLCKTKTTSEVARVYWVRSAGVHGSIWLKQKKKSLEPTSDLF